MKPEKLFPSLISTSDSGSQTEIRIMAVSTCPDSGRKSAEFN